MAVGRLDYDDVREKTVSEIYALLWGPSHTGKEPSVSVSKQATASIKAVLTSNREALVVLHAKLTALLVG